jgi:hypothetical protein
MLVVKKLQCIRRQAGYILFETTVSTFVLISAVVGVLAVQTMMERIDQGRVVGQQYARVSDAVGQYMTVYYTKLKALDANCSELQFQNTNTSTLTTAIASPNSCAIALTSGASTFTIANGMQPTVAELASLGFINANTPNAPALEAATTAYERGLNQSYAVAPLRFHIGISQRCIAISQPPNTLSGRYVLVRKRHEQDGDYLAVDEIEVIADGVNIARSADISNGSRRSADDNNILGADTFYNSRNINDGKTTVTYSDRLTTRAGSAAFTDLPGIFVSNAGRSNSWVRLDLGSIKNISSVGIRRGDGDWESRGNNLAILVSKNPLNYDSQTDPAGMVVAAQFIIRLDTGTPAGQTHYVSPAEFIPAPASSETTVTTPTSGVCPAGTMTALSSMVFNTQPFVLKQWAGSGAMLATVKAQGGANGLMSDPINGGALIGNRSTLTLSNPIKAPPNPPPSTVAPGGIVAFTNGYDPYSSAVQTRADGSTPPTNNWNFNLQSLSGIAGLNAASATVNNNLAVGGQLSANLISTETADSRYLTSNTAKVTNAFALSNVRVANAACNNRIETLSVKDDGSLLFCNNNVWNEFSAAQALRGLARFDSWKQITITDEEGDWFDERKRVRKLIEESCSLNMNDGSLTCTVLRFETLVESRNTYGDSEDTLRQVQTRLFAKEYTPVLVGTAAGFYVDVNDSKKFRLTMNKHSPAFVVVRFYPLIQ